MHKVLKLHQLSAKVADKKFIKVAKFIDLCIRVIFSCDIKYSVKVGKGVQFYHNALGVVIHPRSVIGDDCAIYQNVTLGGNGKMKENNGYPILGKGVFVGAGAVILGPVVVGDNARIGANSVVIHDVEEGDIVVGSPAKSIVNKK